MSARGAALFLTVLLLPAAIPATGALRGADAGIPHGANSMAPPAGSTGGFGEDSCAFCHIDFEENEGDGVLELLGLPAEGWRPGETHELEVRLSHPELRRAGFQLTSRYAAGGAEGDQAGELVAGEGQSLQTPGYTPIAYLGHDLGGIEPTGEGERRWRFRWTAPASAPSGDAAVVFHLAGNAANGDGMEWGDRIYTRAVVLPAAR